MNKLNLSLYSVLAIYLVAFKLIKASDDDGAIHFEPQVAMVCGTKVQYYAQYMSEAGKWVSNPASKVTCAKEKMDILNFCKQSYPDREITNIVEASRFVKVPNFCKIGHSKCKKKSIFVKPYRCLEGSFQSDALLVPEGCLFDHIHNQSKCLEYDEWNSTADQACATRHLSLKAFAMLLPCGIDIFSGVEFVCCPLSYKVNEKEKKESEVEIDTAEEPIALPQTQSTTNQPIKSDTRDEYYSRFDPKKEHDAFRQAEDRLENKHREKVSRIMKEWSDLEERYKELHKTNPKNAEKFKQTMTERFQQTVQKIESQSEAEKRQLTTLHQQRIVAHINEMKREAMSCYTTALSKTLNTHSVQKCLQKLLRALNKDRHHAIAHFRHLLNTDFDAAEREKESTIQHLVDLDRMVNQSLNMLERKPDLYTKIGQTMRDYASSLKSKDDTPPELATFPPFSDDFDDEEEDSDEDDDEEDEDYEEDDEDDDDEESDEDVVEDSDNKKQETVVEHQTTAPERPEIMVRVSPSEKALKTEKSKTGSTADKPEKSGTEPVEAQSVDEPVVAHAQHHSFVHHQPTYSVTRQKTSSDSKSVYLTLAFAGMALMGAMLVGIAMLRKRNNSNPANQGFIEVNQTVSPEEKHVSNMQVNGYENPTYKYFEEK